MAIHTHATDPSLKNLCGCCGNPIRLLGDQKSLSLFLDAATTQRRAFQCVNCGRLVCSQCGADGSCCICRSNAWVAIPCLDPIVPTSHKQPRK